MKCNDKEWQDCSVEKMGCTGCYYNEIEIGEYVRSETGRIDQVTDNEYYLPQYIECKKGIIRRTIQDLIKERDILRYKLKGLDSEYITIVKKYHDARSNQDWLMINGYKLEQVEILGIIACEKYEKEEYKV